MTLVEFAQPRLPVAALVTSVSADCASALVALRGEADLFTLPVVIDVLTRVIADTDGPIIVDLAETEFIDTAVVRALGRASEFLGDHGRALVVRSPSRVALLVLGVLGLSHLVEPGTEGAMPSRGGVV